LKFFSKPLESRNVLVFGTAVKSPFIPLFQRGKKRNRLLKAFKRALLPLKKEGWEGFLGRPIQKGKLKKSAEER